MAFSSHLIIVGLRFLLWLIWPLATLAQFDMMIFERRIPQAQTWQELDLFLEIMECSEPSKTVELVKQFLGQFPKSEFLNQVYRMQMKAYRGLDNYQGAVASGEKALELNSHDVDTLLTLAIVFPHGIDEGKETSAILNKAESYAKQALEEIASLKAPRTLPPAEWRRLAAQMKASAHEALGIVAFKRQLLSQSVTEFEAATRLNPMPDGAQYFRLGMAYLLDGKLPQAELALKRASELGPELVTSRAKEQLARMSDTPKSSPR